MADNYPIAPLTKHIDCIKDPKHHNIRHLLQCVIKETPIKMNVRWKGS